MYYIWHPIRNLEIYKKKFVATLQNVTNFVTLGN